jgi:hypothetical protein
MALQIEPVEVEETNTTKDACVRIVVFALRSFPTIAVWKVRLG